MTREEAIKVIRKMLAYTDLSVRANLTADMVDACHMAIKALEQEPTTKNDLGVDAVSRKAVINQIFYSTDNNGDVVLGSALRERIARLPSVTPQLSSELEKNSKKLEKDFGESDCISRADAIRVASGYCHPSNVAKELAKLPSVTPQEPKTGHWIEHPHEWGDNWQYSDYECSICHNWAHFDTDFCPNCGAKMVESEE